MKAGQGYSGKKSVNALTMFDQLFEVQEDNLEEDIEDSDELMSENEL
jgi:hypothetical protein